MPAKRPDPRIQTAHKTAIFRIHNPSQKKRAMLDDCLYRYHLAFEKALRAVFAELAELKALDKRSQTIRIRVIALAVSQSLPLGGASKDGVVNDTEATVTPPLDLWGENINSPSRRIAA